MKTKAYMIAAAVLFGGFAVGSAEAGSKLVSKGRAGYVYKHVHRTPSTAVQKQDARRPTTIALDVDQKREKRRTMLGGRAAGGHRSIRR